MAPRGPPLAACGPHLTGHIAAIGTPCARTRTCPSALTVAPAPQAVAPAAKASCGLRRSLDRPRMRSGTGCTHHMSQSPSPAGAPSSKKWPGSSAANEWLGLRVAGHGGSEGKTTWTTAPSDARTRPGPPAWQCPGPSHPRRGSGSSSADHGASGRRSVAATSARWPPPVRRLMTSRAPQGVTHHQPDRYRCASRPARGEGGRSVASAHGALGHGGSGGRYRDAPRADAGYG